MESERSVWPDWLAAWLAFFSALKLVSKELRTLNCSCNFPKMKLEKPELQEGSKIGSAEASGSRLKAISDPVYIDLTTDSEENNFGPELDGVLKPTGKTTRGPRAAETPYYFDRDELILKTIENFYKFGILPVVKILKCELSCHHARFIELMLMVSFKKNRETSKQLFNCLPNLYTTMIIKQNEIIVGLDKIIQNIDEIELDNPFAAMKTLHLIKFLINTGVLYETYMKMLPQVFYEYTIRNNHYLRNNVVQAPEVSAEMRDLIIYSSSYDECIKEYLKEIIVYKEVCQEIIDVLYKSKDSEKILQFFDNVTESYLVHEFLILYIQRSIFRSLSYVLKVSETLEELMYKIPRSVMEMTFIRLLGTMRTGFAESIEAQELLCIFLGRSIIDGLVSGSLIRSLNRVQIGGRLGTELISRTVKWIKYNKNHYRFKDQGSILVLSFPTENILNRRVKILGLILNFLRTGDAIMFPKRLDELDRNNIDIMFTLKTLVKRFLWRDNGLAYKMVQIFELMANNGQIGKTIVRIVINDIAKVIHLIPGYGVHSERNLAKLRNALKEEGIL